MSVIIASLELTSHLKAAIMSHRVGAFAATSVTSMCDGIMSDVAMTRIRMRAQEMSKFEREKGATPLHTDERLPVDRWWIPGRSVDRVAVSRVTQLIRSHFRALANTAPARAAQPSD